MSKCQSLSEAAVGAVITDASRKKMPSVKAAKSNQRQLTKTKPVAATAKSVPTSETSKSDQILKLLRRKKGASLAEMQDATGWQSHSVRGFLSGTVKKRMGFSLKSEKDEKGGRRYLIVEA